MSALLTRIWRRQFGLAREVFIARCAECRWKTECRELSTAVSLCRNHDCAEEAA